MDFIAKYGSSPVDRKKVPAIDANGNETEVALDSAETVAYVFKTMSEAHFGELSFFRVYSGAVHSGTDLFNSDRKVTERIGQIYLLNGQNRETVNTPRRGRHRRGGETQGHAHRQHAVLAETSASRCPRWFIPSRTSTPRWSRSQGRGGQNRLRPGRACTRKTRRFSMRWTRNCTRRSFPRRANCTWKSWPTVCAAVTMSTWNWPSRA